MLFSFDIIIVFALYNKFAIDQLDTEKSLILSEIITNYLIKYFGDDKVSISIIFPASQKFEEKYFWDDFFRNLFDDSAFKHFDHNTLHKLDESNRDNRESFHIILIDEHENGSLE